MKIGLFFGSFNPIHTGHLIIANFFANDYTDKVWFIVSPQNPLKKSSDLLKAKVRLHLTKAAVKSDNRFDVSNIEFKLPSPSYTINTLQILTQKFPENDFFLILGSDNFKNIKKWKQYQEILKNYNLLVYERPGFAIKKQTRSKKIKIADAPLLNISSTAIRQLIVENKSIRYLVPKEVRKEIEAKGYYRK